MSVSIGIYEKALPQNLPWEERLTRAQSSRFDFVELSIDESDERLGRLDPSSLERRAIRDAVVYTGLPLKTMCLSGHRRFALGSSSAATRQRADEIFARAIDLGCELGVRIIQVTGHFVYYEEETPFSANYYQEGLARALELAAGAGIMLAIENMDTGGIISLRQGIEFVRQFDSPWLKLYPDIGNLSERSQATLTELALARGHMVAMHLKDARPGEPRRVPFGEGTVPFGAAFAKLRELGFQGPYMIEMWNDNSVDSERRAQAARAWIVQKMAAAGLIQDQETL